MKKFITLGLVALMAATLVACKDGGSAQDTDFDLVGPVPVLIDRGILLDAVWGVGEDIPANESCVAGSQLVFHGDDNPFTIKKNDFADDKYASDAIIVSSLTVAIDADDEMRSETCPAEDVSYIISASDEAPIDIEAAGEGCPQLGDIATEDGVGFPNASSFVQAHFEPEEVITDILDDCDIDNPPEGGCAVITKEMFKLVIDGCATVGGVID